MKKTKAIIIIIFLIIMCFNIQITSAYKENDLFKDILKETNSRILGCGVNSFFEYEGNNEEFCIKLLQELGIYDISTVNIVRNDSIYRLEFTFNSTKGFIQSANNSNSITLNIDDIDSVENLALLEDKIRYILNRECKNIKNYRYVKAKLPNMKDEDIEKVEKMVINQLKNENTTNISSIKINNGYSINGYTQKYESIKSGNKLIDFHCIICNYDSGNYIILGSPEIRITY